MPDLRQHAPGLIHVRRATLPDVPDVVQVGREAWWDTFGPLVGAGYVEAGLARAWNPMVISAEIADGRVLICRIGAEIAGMASADCRDGETFLSRLYVRPGCQGRGIGSLLLDAVLREAPGRVVLTVLSGNERARALYERPGFREQSRRPDPDGGPEHVRMVRLPGRGAELAFACAD